ncbi:MAG: glycoside hydrolase family 2 TIM barrel-domain containing protein [Calditrichia bacterium]
MSSGWAIHAGAELTGKEVSGAKIDTIGWYPATVPSTVLAALVKDGKYKNPYFGENLSRIPTEQFRQPWWYRNEFVLNKKQAARHIRLTFNGINYRANIWLNQEQIASADSTFGAYRRFRFDITGHICSGKNVLAVEVFPPKPGDFTIGFVDWNPMPPDSAMGIWRDVQLEFSGPVAIDRPFVQTKLDLETLDQAAITISTVLDNRTGESQSGELKGEIGGIEFQQSYSLNPHEQKKITFSPAKFKQLNVQNPKPWWPNNLGEPNLYQLTLSVSANKQTSDMRSVRFGIREVSDYFNDEGHRGYKINGKKIVIRGGGWTDDMMLVEDPEKIESQIKYVRHMNLNTIRLEGFWGNSQTLFDLCDKYGILVMAGWSCQWEWKNLVGKETDEFGGIKSPEDIALVSEYLRDQILWLRNHPSIFVWVLGSDKLPRPKLEQKYEEILPGLDDTRPTLRSCGTKVSEVSGPTGVKMNGPYDYVPPVYWYTDTTHGGAFGFNTETGPGPQPPPLESIEKMIPKDHLWPIDSVWNFHCNRGMFRTMERYLDALDQRYGPPENVKDFAMKAQITNYEAIRAMFEAFSVNKFKTTGIIQWMLNSAWPAMFWQLYDYYLMPNGAFYGTKTASQPLNIVYNYGDNGIYVVSDKLNSFKNFQAEIRMLNLQSETVFSKDIRINMDENTSKKILNLPEMEGITPVYFVDLKLKSDMGKVVGSNFYWLSTKKDVPDDAKSLWYVTPTKEYADFTSLRGLPQVAINVQHRFEKTGKNRKVTVTMENPTNNLAFFIELKVTGDKSGQTILPVFWDDNYVSILPGETRTISATFAEQDLNGEKPVFSYEGWNVVAGE